jgi:hypothetical protein
LLFWRANSDFAKVVSRRVGKETFMNDFWHKLFSGQGFMPHGYCYFWNPGVLWLQVVSDALIALAYYSIPFTLIYFIRKRRDVPFNWMFLCFAIFIIACGTTHLMEILVIWHPVYGCKA